MTHRFYVYTLVYPDGKVFYVGKGQKSRIIIHEWIARQGATDHKSNTIRKIWREGGEVIRVRIFETDDEQQAFRVERETIAHYGRENLTNHTDGGDGMSGWKPSEETLRKMSLASKDRKHTPEELLRMSESQKGRTKTPEHCAKIKESWKRRPRKEKVKPPKKDRHVKTERARQAVVESNQRRRGEKRSQESKVKAAAGHRKYNYSLVSPDGEVYSDIPLLKDFCAERGLNPTIIYQMGAGKVKQHKGWRLAS